jgi:hypothetical protein
MTITVSWNVAPCSLVEVDRWFGGLYRLRLSWISFVGEGDFSAKHPQIQKHPKTKILRSDSFTLKMKAANYSESSVKFYQCTRHNIAGDRNHHLAL